MHNFLKMKAGRANFPFLRTVSISDNNIITNLTTL